MLRQDRPVGPFLPADRPGPGGLKGRGAAWRLRRGSRERRSLVIPRERSSLVARGTEGPAHSRKALRAFRTTTLYGGRFHRPPTRRTPAFAALCAASSGERRSPGDVSREGAVGSLRRSAPCADDREGPPVPRPAGVAASPPRNWLPAAPATRAAAPREDTTGRIAAEARRSEDLRSSAITKISDFRTTASRGQRGDRVASSRASGRRGGEPASNSRRVAPRMAREQQSRVPRAFWTLESLI